MNEIFMEGYFDYLLTVRRLKHESVKDVKCSFRRLREFTAIKGLRVEYYDLDRQDFVSFFNWCRDSGKSGQSINKYVAHFRTFLNYCWKVGKVSRNVLDGFSLIDNKRRIPPSVLTIEQVEKLIKDLPQRNFEEKQKRLIILTLYGLGLRTGELCRLDFKHIDFERREAFIFKSKREVNRHVPIPNGLFVELAVFIKGQRRKGGPLFQTSVKKKRLSVGYVANIVKEVSLKAGLENVTPKTFRHSFGSHLIERGVAIHVVSSLMGHKTPSETGVYLHSNENQRKKSIDQLETIITKDDEL